MPHLPYCRRLEPERPLPRAAHMLDDDRLERSKLDDMLCPKPQLRGNLSPEPWPHPACSALPHANHPAQYPGRFCSLPQIVLLWIEMLLTHESRPCAKNLL